MYYYLFVDLENYSYYLQNINKKSGSIENT